MNKSSSIDSRFDGSTPKTIAINMYNQNLRFEFNFRLHSVFTAFYSSEHTLNFD